MIVSSFLSMWISNTATTAMMLPIANAVLEQLKETELQAEEQEFQVAAQGENTLELSTKQTKEEIMVIKLQPEDSVGK